MFIQVKKKCHFYNILQRYGSKTKKKKACIVSLSFSSGCKFFQVPCCIFLQKNSLHWIYFTDVASAWVRASWLSKSAEWVSRILGSMLSRACRHVLFVVVYFSLMKYSILLEDITVQDHLHSKNRKKIGLKFRIKAMWNSVKALKPGIF